MLHKLYICLLLFLMHILLTIIIAIIPCMAFFKYRIELRYYKKCGSVNWFSSLFVCTYFLCACLTQQAYLEMPIPDSLQHYGCPLILPYLKAITQKTSQLDKLNVCRQ